LLLHNLPIVGSNKVSRVVVT